MSFISLAWTRCPSGQSERREVGEHLYEVGIAEPGRFPRLVLRVDDSCTRAIETPDVGPVLNTETETRERSWCSDASPWSRSLGCSTTRDSA